MDRVCSEFHKNVSVLTKFVPPADEFKKQFREGMFDKPNTQGFIHVSHYLLAIYYKDGLKNKVSWPIIDKQSETKFRNDVKNCLQSIASNHPDMHFPAILPTILITAKGTKFLLIMWKLSIVTLSTYLQRDQYSIQLSPLKFGPCHEVTKKFFKNITKGNYEMACDLRNQKESMEKEAKKFLDKQSQTQAKLKLKILKLKEDLKEIVKSAPVNDVAKQHLMNVEDKIIIEMWVENIREHIEKLKENTQYLRTINDSVKNLANIVLNITGDSIILNGANLEKVDIDLLYKHLPPDKQTLACGLYLKEEFNILNFFQILFSMLQKHKKSSQKSDFSKCQLQLELSNKDLKQLLQNYQQTIDEVIRFINEDIERYNVRPDLQEILPNIPELKEILFMPSPIIQINDYSEQQFVNQNSLRLTPKEDTHKKLFSRHAMSKGNMPLTRKPLPIQRINFNDSTSSERSNRSSQNVFDQTSLSSTKSSIRNTDKYSRLFSTKRPNMNKVNNSAMMMMSNTGSSMLPLMKQQCFALDSCCSSQDFSEETLLMNPNMNSTAEIPKQDDKSWTKVGRRRSIGDLVERYKKIVEKSTTSKISVPEDPDPVE